MRTTLLLALVAAPLCFPVYAQTVSRLALAEARIAAKSDARLFVEFVTESGSAWCGLEVDWGNGIKRDIRVGYGESSRSPFTIGNAYDNPGTYTIRVQGKFLSRGLKSATPCQVSAQSVTVTVFDAVAEQQQREAVERSAARERESAEREKRAQDEAAKAKSESAAVKRAAAERELELNRKEAELKQRERELELDRREAELKQREQALQRNASEPKAAEPKASSPAAPTAPSVRYLGTIRRQE